MSGLYAIAASLTLIAPLFAQTLPAPDTAPETLSAPQCNAPDVGSAQHSEPPRIPFVGEASAANPLDAFHRYNRAGQVRIERRVTVRIAPYRQSNRNSLLAQLPRRGVTQTFEERKMASCVPVSGIAGVQTGNGNRLLLFLRDQRIVSLNLERGCRSRDFYSGFYVERNEDGRLCVKRDQLQSRSGAKCEVERMRQLVEVDD